MQWAARIILFYGSFRHGEADAKPPIVNAGLCRWMFQVVAGIF